MNTIERADVDIASTVQTHPIGKSGRDGGKEPLVGDPGPLFNDVQGIDGMGIVSVIGAWRLNCGAVDDIERSFIGREGNAIGHLQAFDDGLEGVRLRIESIDVVGKIAFLRELQTPVARIGKPHGATDLTTRSLGELNGFPW